MTATKRKDMGNPDDMEISISLPTEVKITLVPVTDLKQYELFGWLLVLFSPIAIGFWTAFFTVIEEGQSKSQSLFWSASAFTVCTLVFLGLAIYKRRNLFENGVARKQNFNTFK